MTSRLSRRIETFAAALAERYRLERKLGAGGMATFYLAEDARHHRTVAVKVLHPELAAVLGAERFLLVTTGRLAGRLVVGLDVLAAGDARRAAQR